MEIKVIVSLVLQVVAFVIGLAVFFRGSNNRESRIFGILTFFIITWSFSVFLADISKSYSFALFWSKMAVIGPIFFGPTIYYFSLIILYQEGKSSLFKKVLILISVLFLLVFVPTEANVKEISLEDWGTDFTPGYLYSLLLAYLIVYIVFSVKNLLRKFKNLSSRNEKNKIIYVFISLALVLIVGIITNLIFPLFGLGYLSSIGPSVAVLLFVYFVSYAVVKGSFFGIRIILTEILASIVIIISCINVLKANNSSELFFEISVFILLSIISIMLVRGVISEDKRKEELQLMSDKLAVANDQLRKLDNAKSDFISIASHQLRTPLTAIKGFVSMILEGSYGKITAKQEDVMNKVYMSNSRLIDLVEDLLNISRVESGRMDFKLAPASVEDICREVVDTLAMKAKARKIYLDWKRPETALPKIVIDEFKVREVISNLMENAIKFTEKGGVTVKAELFPKVQPSEKVEPSVRVVVSDTGIGISQEDLPYLFSKFSRIKDTTRLNIGGTGLGLYVGKIMIEGNGGKIWAESDGAGRGSRFIIELPVAQSEELMKRWGNMS